MPDNLNKTLKGLLDNAGLSDLYQEINVDDIEDEKVQIEKLISPPSVIDWTPYNYKPVYKDHQYSTSPIPTTSVEVDVGIRYDDGKLPMHLLPPELLTEVAKVLAFGAKKYAPRNWEKGMDWSRVYASLMRHLVRWQEGEDIDPETGLNHIAHVACNAAFLLAYINRENGKDDRPDI